MFSVLIGVAILGIIFLACLREAKIPETVSAIDNEDKEIEIVLSPLETLKNAFRFFFTKDMLLLSVCFFYTGKWELIKKKVLTPLCYIKTTLRYALNTNQESTANKAQCNKLETSTWLLTTFNVS